VNACLDRVNELITTATSDLVTRELPRLLGCKRNLAELATLRGRVDALEASAAELSKQFSTTTKLTGKSLLGWRDRDWRNADGDELDDSTVLVDRARLELNTNFTGEDLLFTRLETLPDSLTLPAQQRVNLLLQTKAMISVWRCCYITSH